MTCLTAPGLRVALLAVGDVPGLMTIDVTGVTATIDLAVPAGGIHRYKIWLSDSATDPKLSTTAPSSGAAVEWEGVTDADGNVTITFVNSNSSHTWYAWCTLEKVNISEAITVGL